MINRDRIINELTLDDLDDRKLALINDYIEHEVVLTSEIEERAGDRNASGLSVKQKSITRLLGHDRNADLMMLSVPLVDTTKIGNHFGIDPVTDDFKVRLLRTLTTGGHINAGMIGGRILMLGVDPNLHADIIQKAVDDAKLESKALYAGLLSATERAEFQKKQSIISPSLRRRHLCLCRKPQKNGPYIRLLTGSFSKPL